MKLYPIIITLMLVLTILVLALPGSIQQKTVDQVDGSELITSIETVSQGEKLWSDDFTNQTSWTTSRVTDIRTQLQVNKSLDLTVTFPEKASPQDLSVARNLNLSLDRDPLVTVQVTVSKGIYYGLRFFGISSTGTSLVAWHEGSNLQHRPGLGIFETINANLGLEVYLAMGQLPSSGSRITRIVVYLEATPGTSGEFSMRIIALQALSLHKAKLDSREVSGALRGVMINLEGLPANRSIFQIFLGIDISGTPNLTYTSYFTQGLVVEAQGFRYLPKSITTYELVVLVPQRVFSSPPFLPNPNSTSSVMVAAEEGEITFFRLNSLTLRFTSIPIISEGDVESKLTRFILLNYYLMFLFGLPIMTVVLIVKVFKPGK